MVRAHPGTSLLTICDVGIAFLVQFFEKTESSLGGLEPPTFRLTAERANRLRHRDSTLIGEFNIKDFFKCLASHFTFLSKFFMTMSYTSTMIKVDCGVPQQKRPIEKNSVRRPGVEPGSTAWKATMLTVTPPTLG